MKLKIAICDDEQSQLDYLCALVGSWSRESGHLSDVMTFPSAEAFLFEYSESKAFDILLLDIEMKEMDGIELARRVRSDNGTVQIIFITGFYDFIAEGYEVSALHYLMKPVSKEKLCSVLSRAVEKLGKAEGRLTVSFDRQTEYIPFPDIFYLEAQMNYTVVHTKHGDIKTKTPLSDMAKQLDDGFFRCQRSFAINLAQVQKIRSDSVLLKNGVAVPISRGMSEAIGKAIISHF